MNSGSHAAFIPGFPMDGPAGQIMKALQKMQSYMSIAHMSIPADSQDDRETLVDSLEHIETLAKNIIFSVKKTKVEGG